MTSIINYIKYIFMTPISDLQGLHFMVMITLYIIGLATVIGSLIGIFKFVSLIFRGTRNIVSAKSKCQHIQCRTCGRTLDRCVCQKNKDRGNASRLYNYNKEEHARKKAKKKK